MKKSKLKVTNFIWLAVALLVLLGLIGISFLKQSHSTKDLTKTWEIKSKISNLTSAVKDAETGQRGYIITSKTDYLVPYHSALTAYDKEYRELINLMKSDSLQQKRLNSIDSLISLKFFQLERNINIVETGNDSLVELKIKTDLGKLYMDGIRDLSYQLTKREEEKLDDNIRNYKNWRLTSIVLALLSALLVIYCLVKIYREVYPVFNEIVDTRKELHNTSANLAETIKKLKESEKENLKKLEEKSTEIKALKVKNKQLKDNKDKS